MYTRTSNKSKEYSSDTRDFMYTKMPESRRVFINIYFKHETLKQKPPNHTQIEIFKKKNNDIQRHFKTGFFSFKFAYLPVPKWEEKKTAPQTLYIYTHTVYL